MTANYHENSEMAHFKARVGALLSNITVQEHLSPSILLVKVSRLVSHDRPPGKAD